MRRREFLAMALALALMPGTTLSRPSSTTVANQGTFYFVLIDTSASIKKTDHYDEAWNIIKKLFKGGDRMAIALVKGDVPGQPGATFKKLEDKDLKAQS